MIYIPSSLLQEKELSSYSLIWFMPSVPINEYFANSTQLALYPKARFDNFL